MRRYYSKKISLKKIIKKNYYSTRKIVSIQCTHANTYFSFFFLKIQLMLKKILRKFSVSLNLNKMLETFLSSSESCRKTLKKKTFPKWKQAFFFWRFTVSNLTIPSHFPFRNISTLLENLLLPGVCYRSFYKLFLR